MNGIRLENIRTKAIAYFSLRAAHELCFPAHPDTAFWLLLLCSSIWLAGQAGPRQSPVPACSLCASLHGSGAGLHLMSPTWLLSLQLASLKAPTQVLPSGLGTHHALMCEFAERSMGYDVPAGHDMKSLQILACDWEHLLAAGAVTCYSTPLRVPLC